MESIGGRHAGADEGLVHRAEDGRLEGGVLAGADGERDDRHEGFSGMNGLHHGGASWIGKAG